MYISFVRNPKVLETVTAVDHDESAVFGSVFGDGIEFRNATNVMRSLTFVTCLLNVSSKSITNCLRYGRRSREIDGFRVRIRRRNGFSKRNFARLLVVLWWLSIQNLSILHPFGDELEPAIGYDSTPIRHEIEFSKILPAA